MTDFIIKRSGEKVPFDRSKLEKWAEWAANNEVNWQEILDKALVRCPNGVTTKDFHKALIDACLDTKDFYSVRMAGRLLLGQLYKDVFGDFSNKLPVKYFYKSMVSQGLWEDLKYSDEELDYLENIIDHSKDFKYEYVTIRQCIDKYLLKDKISKKIYETPQYMFLGMAMATMKDMPKERKLKDVEKLYNCLSDLKINAPTPLMNALRTSFKGYASCCVIKSDDTAPSINAAIDAAYTFTTAQAGIGIYIDTRSVGDPVNNGRTVHSGKLPYYRYLDAAVRSSKQLSRGGASTIYYPVLDPELSDLIKAKNIKTPDQKRVNFVDYSLQTNSFFWDKVCKKDKWMLVSRYYAPKLYELFFSADLKGFEEEYVRVLKEESIPKKIVNALDVAKEFCVTRQESGRVYPAFVDEMNRHTPFKETIYSSNLCVAPDTLLLTRKGEFRIADLEGQDVEVWNGEEWSKTTVVKTGENQEVLKVLTYNSILICTPYHKFYLEDGSEVRAIDLAQGMKLERWVNIDGEVIEDIVMCVITHNEEPTDTFCVNEPLRHKCVFNGILTGQCEEIHLPTKGIKNSGKLYKYSEDSGEIAMCFLSAIVLERVTEEEYEDVAYYTTLMVDKTIDEMVYPYDSVRYTSTRRRNIGIGLTNLACDLATKGLSYTTKEGRDYIHKIAERHEYYLHKASLRLAKEFGVAEWIDKTKYVDGWLPIDTMKDLSFVDVDQTLHYDWETLRKEIKEVGGIRNSVLSSHMPVESSSQVSNTTNGLYPVRDLFIIKKSGSNTNAFFSPHYEDLATRYSYEFAYDVPTERLLEVYAIVQKFTGQGISGDTYLDLTKNKMSLKQSIKEMVYASKLGLKTLYYSNSKTEKKMEQEESDCTACKL